MKLTKVLKEKTEKELSNARLQADKKARADYDARRNNAEAEIEALIDGITPAVQTILEKYGMDTDNATEKTTKDYRTIIRFYASEIRNRKEADKLYEAERARYNKQKALIEEFAIECELGVEKENFLKALANLCSKMAD